MTASIRTAFVPGAGLGKRLRPLTSEIPKPLVPVFGKPLITFAFDNLIACGVERFVVNTHHRPGAYDAVFAVRNGRGEYRGHEVRLVHEPVLLETAGGIRNARREIGDEPFLVYNGDILADLPLDRLAAHHFEQGAEVTLLLRSSGGPLEVRFDPASARVAGFRGETPGGRKDAPEFLFTGAYVIDPAFIDRIPDGAVISVIPIFLDMLRTGAPIAGLADDGGAWADLGSRLAYLGAHHAVASGAMRLPRASGDGWPQPVQPGAKIAPDAILRGACSVGKSAEIGSEVELVDCVLWDGAKIASGTRMHRCIVRTGRLAGGTHTNTDF